jgi:hypothetical protein
MKSTSLFAVLCLLFTGVTFSQTTPPVAQAPNPAYAEIPDVPGLPRVLLLGGLDLDRLHGAGAGTAAGKVQPPSAGGTLCRDGL